MTEMQITATASGKTEVGIVKQASLEEEFGRLSPQLRAILRASALGPVRMMLPMISNVQELRQVLRLVKQRFDI